VPLPASGDVTRLTVLLILSIGPNHGYGLREMIETWNMEAWADIRYGSIYQSLRTMKKDGLVAEDRTEAQGKHPPKTIYRITEAGRDELLRLLRKAWAEPSRYVDAINVALSFEQLNLLDDDQVDNLLAERLQRLDEAIADLRENEATAVQRWDDPGYRALMEDHFDHFHRLIEADRQWTTRVRARVRQGAYRPGEEKR
jgi:DNA-binding PadR family transcriptional regulator